jgi:ABC-type glucose/galactose transport system permease subunit
MIGIVIGVVFSAIIFTVISYDKKGVEEYRKKTK